MRRAAYLFAIVLLATLAACGRGLPKNPESGAPVIDAKPLPTAITEEAFNVELTATGGEKPLEWSIESVPGELSWLTIDPATGVLGGTPTEAFDSTVAFVAKVKDAKGRVASKPFALEVRECLNDGDSKTCYGSDGSSCFTSSSTCSGGKLAACTGGTPSIMFDHCGAGEETKCGVCSAVSADACDGVCKCGGAPACSSGTPDCCSSLCTNRASDKDHCGACETVCQSGPSNSQPVCAGGSCGWACNIGFTKCGEACVDIKTDRLHCNGCSTPCNDGYFCNNGSCSLDCEPLTLCGAGAACVDTKTNVNNCGDCNIACVSPDHGSASCSAGGCVYSCTGSYSLCPGSSCYDLSNDVKHCGSCTAAACPGPTTGSGSAICSGRSCDIQCAANTKQCGTNCCSATDNGTASCNGASCDVTCNSGYTKCGISCVQLGTEAHCATCADFCGDDCQFRGQVGVCTASKTCQCACPDGEMLCGTGTDRECMVSCPSCFTAGTPVSLANGTLSPIELVAVGDQVLSYDPERGGYTTGSVTRVFVHPDTPRLLRINGVLTTTPEHPFYVNGEWLRADQLQLGDRLLSAESADDAGQLGADPIVMSIEELPGGVTTYNLEVGEIHDYFAGGVLVHNKVPTKQ